MKMLLLLLHLFVTSNSVVLLMGGGGRNNVSCLRAQGTLTTPLTKNPLKINKLNWI